jgi:hypothetical protein
MTVSDRIYLVIALCLASFFGGYRYHVHLCQTDYVVQHLIMEAVERTCGEATSGNQQ